MSDKRSISWRTLALSGGLGLLLGYVVFARTQVAGIEQRQPTSRPELHASELDTINLFKTAAPSVVFINTLRDDVNVFGDTLGKVKVGAGSGYVWDEEGHIVTNYHVVADVDKGNETATVTFDGGESYNAEILGVAPEHDIAVLKITPHRQLVPLPLGRSHDLQVGQQVLAIGNPFGLDHTLTVGIVSALGRTLPTDGKFPIEDAIQTDAAINPGNSGGPLLDSYGRLIGMNTLIVSSSGASAGIGFAIPVDTINRIVPQLIQYGMEDQATLGIGAADYMSERIDRYVGIQGLAILSIVPGSAAEAAGLQALRHQQGKGIYIGDIITEIAGQRVATTDDLDLALLHYKPGDTVAVTYWRGGKIYQKKILLDSSIKLHK